MVETVNHVLPSVNVAWVMLCPEVKIIISIGQYKQWALFVKVIWEWKKEIIMKHILSYKFIFELSSGLWVRA